MYFPGELRGYASIESAAVIPCLILINHIIMRRSIVHLKSAKPKTFLDLSADQLPLELRSSRVHCVVSEI